MTQNRPSAEQEQAEQEQPLFRPEVMAEQKGQWLGKVLLVPSLPHILFSIFALFAGIAIVSLLFFSDYTRKERVVGWLVPEKGLVKIFTPQSGIVTQLDVTEGDDVAQGEALLTISSERQSEAFGATQEEIVQRLKSRRESLLSEMEINRQISEQELTDLSQQITESLQDILLRGEEIQVQRERVDLAESSAIRLGKASKGGVITRDQWLDSEDVRLEQLMILRGLERDLANSERKKLTLQSQLAALPLNLKKSEANLQRQIDTLEQEIAEVESQRQLILTAPEAGTVSVLQLKQGNSVQPSESIMSILPQGSELQAKLNVPTRAIGFIEVGQTVLLRYKAFPYQKFGHYEGTIASVSRSTVKLGDTEFASNNTFAPNEQVYLVDVTLEKQHVNAYGKAIPLQPGMEFEADIQLEKRRLIEWVLEPLYTLTGRPSE